MPVSPYPTFPHKREKGQTNRYASFTLKANVEGAARLVPYDENLLERARTQWQFGDWANLRNLGCQQFDVYVDLRYRLY